MILIGTGFMKFIKLKLDKAVMLFHTFIRLAHNCQQFRLFAFAHVRWINRLKIWQVSFLYISQCQSRWWWKIKPEILYLSFKKKGSLKTIWVEIKQLWEKHQGSALRGTYVLSEDAVCVWSYDPFIVGSGRNRNLRCIDLCQQTCDIIPWSKIKLPL